jgi:glycosyltransferase involved in cell wall biosynthesis
VTGAPVLMPADVRFPLERANGVQLVKTAAALAASGRRTTLFVRRSDPRPTAEVLALYGVDADERLTIERADVGHRAGAFALPRLRFLARAGFAAWRALRGGAVVFTRDLQLADLVLRAFAGPLVYEAHAVEALMYGERGALYGTSEQPDRAKAARIAAREARVWRRAAGFVTTTRGILDSFNAAHGPRARTRVIPNGTDVAPDRAFPGLASGTPPRILYAGQLYPWKGVDVLVRACVSVPGARLVILGGLAGEADAERIRALVAQCGLADRTELPGTVAPARVADELRRAAVVVAPFLHTAMSERHTSPLKAFEAMAAGRPLVASDLPASREFLRDGENALLTPPGDAAALADALRRLLDGPALAERIARGAWDDAPRYAWSARAAALGALFDEVSA